jgi:signal transduction histidine kinase
MGEANELQARVFPEFWERLEHCRTEVDAAVFDAARRSPAFADVLASMNEDVRAEQDARSRAMQHAALVEGRWDEYVADLSEQGVAYARMGIPFEEWFSLLGAFRPAILADIIPAEKHLLRAVLDGMHVLADTAMATIGAAYVEAKEQMIRSAQGRLQRYIDLVDAAPLAQIVLRFTVEAEEPRAEIANPAAVRLFALGTRADGALTEATAWLRDRGVVDACRRSLVANELETFEIAPPPHGDDPRSFDVRCFPLDTEHVAVTLEDTTERRALQARVVGHIRDLERSNRELDEFAYAASHDLKAPLQDIRNLAHWVTEDVAEILPDDSSRHLSLLSDRVQRMERLLDDLLDYSRVGRARDPATEISLWDLVDTVVEYLQPPPGFEVRHQGVSPQLRCPRPPLEKVLRNLIHNAIRHHDRQSGTVVVSAMPAGDRVHIRVSDDGPGIAPEFGDRVFRMFQTLRPRDQVESTGIGLALVKKTVEFFGGEVKLESKGRGTTIEFTWPITLTDAGEIAS